MSGVLSRPISGMLAADDDVEQVSLSDFVLFGKDRMRDA